jgi:hypothetical protein
MCRDEAGGRKDQYNIISNLGQSLLSVALLANLVYACHLMYVV